MVFSPSSLRCPKEIEAGGTIRFSVFFEHEREGPVNPSGLTCKVYEGIQMATLDATLLPVQDIYGIGSYFADFNVPGSQGSGPLYVVWNGSYESSGTASPLPGTGDAGFPGGKSQWTCGVNGIDPCTPGYCL